MKKIFLYKQFITYIIFIMFLTACASHYQDATHEDPYGFFSGIWHGLILPFSFIGYLFIDDVYVVGQPNTGGTYIFGFIIGLIILFSSGS